MHRCTVYRVIWLTTRGKELFDEIEDRKAAQRFFSYLVSMADDPKDVRVEKVERSR
jgi:hypothetical protein